MKVFSVIPVCMVHGHKDTKTHKDLQRPSKTQRHKMYAYFMSPCSSVASEINLVCHMKDDLTTQGGLHWSLLSDSQTPLLEICQWSDWHDTTSSQFYTGTITDSMLSNRRHFSMASVFSSDIDQDLLAAYSPVLGQMFKTSLHILKMHTNPWIFKISTAHLRAFSINVYFLSHTQILFTHIAQAKTRRLLNVHFLSLTNLNLN